MSKRPRYKARKDRGHSLVKQGLEAAGCSVHETTDVPGGFPDLCVGYQGVTFLVEVKHPDNTPKKNKRTHEQQLAFREHWRGTPVIVAETWDSAWKEMQNYFR